MNIESFMEVLGTIVGSIEASKLEMISHLLKGVAHIEASRKFQVAPPDSEIQ
jgi:hypothetical protein